VAVTQRFVDDVWRGGDWALPELKRFATACRKQRAFFKLLADDAGDGKRVGASSEMALYKLLPVLRELASPRALRAVPRMQFWYETLLGMLFIVLAFAVMASKIDAQQFAPSRVAHLYVFIAGNLLYECGQLAADPDEYFADVWNRIDGVMYSLLLTWSMLTLAYPTEYWMQDSARRCLALNGFRSWRCRRRSTC
jgi:hypothetical protein